MSTDTRSKARTRAKPALRFSRTSEVRCEACGAAVSQSQLIQGDASVVTGRIICGSCCKKKESKFEFRAIHVFVLLTVGYSLGIFFPEKQLVVADASVLGVAVLLAFARNQSWHRRLAGVALCLLLGGICIFFHQHKLLENTKLGDTELDWNRLLDSTQDAISARNFQEANSRLSSLVRSLQEKGRPPAWVAKVSTLQDALDRGMEEAYGASSPAARTCMLRLFFEFSEFENESRRFQSIELTPPSMSLGIAFETAGSVRALVPDLVQFIFRIQPDIERLELTCFLTQEKKINLVLTRSQLSEMTATFWDEQLSSCDDSAKF